VLAQETPVLLLDEPSSSLDVRHQEQVMAIARELASRGAGLLVILHDLNLASAYADTVALMHGGRLAAFGCPREVLREEILSEVFDCPLRVLDTPEIGHPLVIPDRIPRPGESSIPSLVREGARVWRFLHDSAQPGKAGVRGSVEESPYR
jgi:iron complex transport system ATP-binding protein